VAVKVAIGDEQFIFVNEKQILGGCQVLWDPLFSPDGSEVLLRYVEAGKYYRKVVPVTK